MKTGIGALGLLALLSPGDQALAPPAFDPLFEPGAATCAPPARPGQLLLALAAAPKPRTETAPFTPQPMLAAPGVVPRYRNLGHLSYPLGREKPQAQAYFDQGLRLAFAFNHAEAQRAFQAAQRLDPGCALCHWGEAWVLGPNINAPMTPEAQAPALAALARAVALKDGLPAAQRGLIAALTQRYSVDPQAERAALDAAFADALQALAAQHPRDDLIQVLSAEAAMNTQPWDYWQAAGAEPKGRTAYFVPALEAVLKRNPQHAGAIHLYIHAVEASTRPERALAPARRLAAQMPGAGHIVHMPGHIYFRVGLYREALQANKKAIAVDEAYFKTSPSDPMYRSAYYPHNIHFLMVSAQMGGDAATALQAAAKLDDALAPEVVSAIAALQPLKAAPFSIHALFSPPEQVLQLAAPPTEWVLVRALHLHARALAQVRLGRLVEARQEIDALQQLEAQADFKPFDAWGVPAAAIVQTARLVATARLAEAQGDLDAAGRAYEAAVAVEDALPYTEPPHWYHPVRQSLGALRLRQGRLEEAEAALRASLQRTRHNGWALAALAEVYRLKGDRSAAQATRMALARSWFGPGKGPDLARL